MPTTENNQPTSAGTHVSKHNDANMLERTFHVPGEHASEDEHRHQDGFRHHFPNNADASMAFAVEHKSPRASGVEQQRKPVLGYDEQNLKDRGAERCPRKPLPLHSTSDVKSIQD